MDSLFTRCMIAHYFIKVNLLLEAVEKQVLWLKKTLILLPYMVVFDKKTTKIS